MSRTTLLELQLAALCCLIEKFRSSLHARTHHFPWRTDGGRFAGKLCNYTSRSREREGGERGHRVSEDLPSGVFSLDAPRRRRHLSKQWNTFYSSWRTPDVL